MSQSGHTDAVQTLPEGGSLAHMLWGVMGTIMVFPMLFGLERTFTFGWIVERDFTSSFLAFKIQDYNSTPTVLFVSITFSFTAGELLGVHTLDSGYLNEELWARPRGRE